MLQPWKPLQHSLSDLANLVSNNPQEKEEIMTSITQSIRQEARYEGIQKGRQEGRQTRNQEIAKNMLSNMHLDIQTVSQATGLSKDELMKLQEEAKR